MKAFSIVLSGHWGHFRRPEANNNPITYDFIPKPAFIGLLAAVTGLKRDELKNQYKELCNLILYNVQILNPIAKIATNFRIYKYKGSLTSIENPPQFYEVLQEPKFKVTFMGNSVLIEDSVSCFRGNKSNYTPIFGLVNCPVNINSFEELDLKENRKNEVKTSGFIPFTCRPKISKEVTLSYDSIPVVQNNDWFNTRYEKVFYGYVPEGKFIEVGKSDYEHQYTFNGLTYFFI